MYSLQLDLFSWDIVKIGEAFQALSRLDFEGAKSIFEEILSQLPGHSSAKRGVAIVNHWEGVLKKWNFLREMKPLSSSGKISRCIPLAIKVIRIFSGKPF